MFGNLKNGNLATNWWTIDESLWGFHAGVSVSGYLWINFAIPVQRLSSLFIGYGNIMFESIIISGSKFEYFIARVTKWKRITALWLDRPCQNTQWSKPVVLKLFGGSPSQGSSTTDSICMVSSPWLKNQDLFCLFRQWAVKLDHACPTAILHA